MGAFHWEAMAQLVLQRSACLKLDGGSCKCALQVVEWPSMHCDDCRLHLTSSYVAPASLQDGLCVVALAGLLLKLAKPAGANGDLACAFACGGLLYMTAEHALLLSASGESGAEQVGATGWVCSIALQA